MYDDTTTTPPNEGIMEPIIRIKFTREVFSKGERYSIGSIVDLPEAEARALIGMHRAERCDLTDEEAEAAVAEAQGEAAEG